MDRFERRRDEVVSITSAATSRSDDMGAREKRYAISMAIRTVCFLGAVVVSGPLRWVLIAGAVFLPYTSVILANAGVRRRGAGPSAFDLPPRPEIEGGSNRTPDTFHD